MVTLREQAKDFIPKQTKNVSELPVVNIDTEIQTGEGTDKDGNIFQYKYIENNGEEYRVPMIVIGMLKDLLEANPHMKSFKVKRTGEGKVGTRYTVIPLG